MLEWAIRLWQSWGFQVEPGPECGEITTKIVDDVHINTQVWPESEFCAITEVASTVRLAGLFGRRVLKC